MKTSIIVFGLLIAGTIAAFAMSAAEPDLSIRYKVTINVQTPDGVKSGSAVREFTIDKFNGFNPDKADFNAKMRGEAVVIDLEERGKLFALINPNSYTEMLYAFPPPEGAPLSEAGIEHYKNLKVGDKAELSNKIHWPRFVMFENTNDPVTVKLAKRSIHEEDGPETLEEFFSDGVFVKSIEIEVTDERITREVGSYLPWLDDYYQQRLDGNRYGTSKTKHRFANSLSAGAFSIGEEK